MEREFGCIKRIEIPDEWIETPDQSTPLFQMWTFHPQSIEEIEFCVFQRRQGVTLEDMQIFRATLNKGEHRIEESGAELLALTPILGNAGNNQWSNKAKGIDGPNFRFTRGDVKMLNGRPVLYVTGSFIDPESKKSLNEYRGIFVDTGSDSNDVQEIYLQVAASKGYFEFEKFAKAYEKALATINWQ
ncbi:MAG TPA: hypothetical protein V6C76_08545 [Drouetiella sp.]